MMAGIAVGTVCFLVGVSDRNCKRPANSGFNGRTVTVISGLQPFPRSVGGFAYVVAAPWLDAIAGGKKCIVTPACLLPIAGPPALLPEKHEPIPECA